MRLNKYIAHAGICSRRQADHLIEQGDISINGNICKELGIDVKPEDKVYYKGKLIKPLEEKVYFKLNKPIGYTTTLKDPHQKKVVVDLIDDTHRIYPVGRLDKDSCGLIILTNDGDFTYHLTHPKHTLSKTYRVEVKGQPTKSAILNLEKGILMDGYKTKPCTIKKLFQTETTSLYQVVLWEGRNRQIRKMFDSIGHPVVFLQRVQIGEVTLEGLKEGQYRSLTQQELKSLKGEACAST